MLGMSSQLAEKEDTVLCSDVRDKLFGPNEFSRRDLGALNIMRGRDNGVPDYNTVSRDGSLLIIVKITDSVKNVRKQSIHHQSFHWQVPLYLETKRQWCPSKIAYIVNGLPLLQVPPLQKPSFFATIFNITVKFVMFYVGEIREVTSFINGGLCRIMNIHGLILFQMKNYGGKQVKGKYNFISMIVVK